MFLLFTASGTPHPRKRGWGFHLSLRKNAKASLLRYRHLYSNTAQSKVENPDFFAPPQHNVISDPPFSQIDLVSCRNLFIYLEPELQHRVLVLFHYSLRPNGFLVIGASEGITSSTDLFTTEDRVNKIFAKKAASPRALVTFSVNPQTEHPGMAVPAAGRRMVDSTGNYLELQKDFDRRLLSQYSPAAVFVTEDLEIVHTRGDVSQYLALSSGRPSLSLLKMAPEGLLLDLRNAVAHAKKELRSVKREKIQIKRIAARRASDPKAHVLNFEVIPLLIGQIKKI